MCERVLLEVPFGGESSGAHGANERPLFGVGSAMDVQGTLTRKVLSAYITCTVLKYALFTKARATDWGVLYLVKEFNLRGIDAGFIELQSG